MNSDPNEDDDGFFWKYRVPIIGGIVLLVIVGAWFFVPKGEHQPRKASSVSMVNIMPPPPPPPPTPPPTPPPDRPEPEPQEMEEAPKFVEEAAPDSPPEAPPEEAPMGSNIQGNGPPDGFGLVGKGGGGMIGGHGKGKGGAGTKYGAYAGKVQSAVATALRGHKQTRSATLSVKVRVWADASGRITRAALQGSSGDPATDRAITDEILSGLQLPEPPPDDMPMPIVMRISAKRPN